VGENEKDSHTTINLLIKICFALCSNLKDFSHWTDVYVSRLFVVVVFVLSIALWI